MDSLTQAALGAAVGEAVLGRKAGNRALLLGALAGTLPDLDILAHPFIDEVAQLAWHRGYSHALLAQALAAPILGWLFWRVTRRKYGSALEWSILALLALWTHALLDAFTVYGTQLLLPFSNVAVAFNTISIIDPIYTLPLLIGVILSMVYRRTPKRAAIFNAVGIGLSTAYLLFTVGIKAHVGSVFENELARNDIRFQRTMTTPTIFNAALWRCSADLGDSVVVGYYSLFDGDKPMATAAVSKRIDLLPSDSDPAVRRLLWFSKGWFTLTEQGPDTLFHDLRFGKLDVDSPQSASYIFSWTLERKPQNGPLTISQIQSAPPDAGATMRRLLDRIQGTH